MKACKNILVRLMVLTMLFFSFAIMPLKARAESSTMIYFKNTDQWSNVYCYIWKGLGPVSGTAPWPGAEMIKVEGTDDWYQLEYTSESAFQVIFSDNAIPKPNQTGNLPSDLETDESAYWFIPSSATTDQGTSDGYTAEGLSIQILTEAPEDFKDITTTGEGETGQVDTSKTSGKDDSPKTGDTDEPIVIMGVAIVALLGMAVIVYRKK